MFGASRRTSRGAVGGAARGAGARSHASGAVGDAGDGPVGRSRHVANTVAGGQARRGCKARRPAEAEATTAVRDGRVRVEDRTRPRGRAQRGHRRVPHPTGRTSAHRRTPRRRTAPPGAGPRRRRIAVHAPARARPAALRPPNNPADPTTDTPWPAPYHGPLTHTTCPPVHADAAWQHCTRGPSREALRVSVTPGASRGVHPPARRTRLPGPGEHSRESGGGWDIPDARGRTGHPVSAAMAGSAAVAGPAAPAFSAVWAVSAAVIRRAGVPRAGSNVAGLTRDGAARGDGRVERGVGRRWGSGVIAP